MSRRGVGVGSGDAPHAVSDPHARRVIPVYVPRTLPGAPAPRGTRQPTGRAGSRRCRVRAARMVWPSTQVWATHGMAVQAALAKNVPDGVPSAPGLRGRGSRVRRRVLAVLGLDQRERVGAVGGEGKPLPRGQELAWRSSARTRRTTRRRPRLSRRSADGPRRVVLQRLPGGLADLARSPLGRGLGRTPIENCEPAWSRRSTTRPGVGLYRTAPHRIGESRLRRCRRRR